MILYRPVGLDELVLIARSAFRHFPPRLPEQPFFYPVLTRDYAARIARDWNTHDAASGFVGFVTRFEVADAFLNPYAVQTVGDHSHREYWIPAEDLESFNEHINGKIEIIEHFAGASCDLEIDPDTHVPRELDALLEEHADARVWSVWRQDDNGNRFLVRSRMTEAQAQRLASDFEARGHRQMYWVEREA
jgi:hypothetical protein